MKMTLFLLCLLCTSAAFAQRVASISAEPQAYQFQTHEAHASYTAMTQEKSVLVSTNYTTAQGERPASDFPQAEQVSLGVYAREIREQHAQLKKARVIWVNQ